MTRAACQCVQSASLGIRPIRPCAVDAMGRMYTWRSVAGLLLTPELRFSQLQPVLDDGQAVQVRRFAHRDRRLAPTAPLVERARPGLPRGREQTRARVTTYSHLLDRPVVQVAGQAAAPQVGTDKQLPEV